MNEPIRINDILDKRVHQILNMQFDRFIFIATNDNQTDAQLIELLGNMTSTVKRESRAYELTFGGYDDDPRQMWEIQEARPWAKRLVDLGFLSVLQSLPNLDGDTGEVRGWTAYELWLFNRGELGATIDVPLMIERGADTSSEFWRDVFDSNEKSDYAEALTVA